jgi:pimeloyl-ACP methyl ester carboxylesterase
MDRADVRERLQDILEAIAQIQRYASSGRETLRKCPKGLISFSRPSIYIVIRYNVCGYTPVTGIEATPLLVAQERPKMKGISQKLTISAAMLLSLAVTAGFIYERVEERHDRERIPQIGRSIDIGGRSLNIYCSGQGDPAVILESAGGPGYIWAQIQPEIAKFTTACWYDRAGEGWSDPGPFPRTSAAIAKDLHELLRRAGISRRRYVLVGWSFGGLNVRVYSGIYPSDVAGAVLIDSAHEDEPARAPKFFLAPTAPRFLWYPLYLALNTAAQTGALRLIQHSSRLPENPTRQEIIRALRQQPRSVVTDATTGIVEPESYAQARAAAGMGDRPLIILTAGKPQRWRDPEMARQAAAYQQVWIHEMQSRLAQLSTRGRQIVIENSDHGIPMEAPETVIGAIREVVTDVRAEETK